MLPEVSMMKMMYSLSAGNPSHQIIAGPGVLPQKALESF